MLGMALPAYLHACIFLVQWYTCLLLILATTCYRYQAACIVWPCVLLGAAFSSSEAKSGAGYVKYRKKQCKLHETKPTLKHNTHA